MSYLTQTSDRIHPSYVFLSEDLEVARRALSSGLNFTEEDERGYEEKLPKHEPKESDDTLDEIAFKIFRAGARISRISLILGLVIIILQVYIFFLLSGLHAKVQSLEGQVIGDFYDYRGNSSGMVF